AGPRLALVKPLQPWRSGAQIGRHREAADHHLRLGEEAVALLAGPRPHRARRQVARRSEIRPPLAYLAVEPAPGIDHPNPGIDRLDPRPLRRAAALGAQNINRPHASPPTATRKRRL